MSAPARTFAHKPAIREAQRAFLSFSGASGGGKTKSALEVATGLVSVTGGRVFVVDTENGRALKYAPAPGEQPEPGRTYDFEHVPFDPPFDPDSYLAALRHCEASGAGAVIFDSMSHEHAGEGGRLDSQLAEAERLASRFNKSPDAFKFAAFGPNSAARKRLLWGGFFRSRAHIILCFRAKETMEQRGKEILDCGFTAVGGEEFIFEADASILFMPGAAGVPTWKSEKTGERKAIKLPQEYRGILDDGRPMSADHGRRLALWLNAGNAVKRPGAPTPAAHMGPDATPAGGRGGPQGVVRQAGETAAPGPVMWGETALDPDAPQRIDFFPGADAAEVKAAGAALRACIERASSYGLAVTWWELNDLAFRARSPALANWIAAAIPQPENAASGEAA